MVDGLEATDPQVARHLESCPTCQRELGDYLRLRDTLRSLRAEHVGVAPALLDQVLEALARAAPPGRWQLVLRRRVLAATVGLGVVGMTLGAVILTLRRGALGAEVMG